MKPPKFKIKKLSIILPTFNEAENIVDLIKKIEQVVKRQKEIIVVDDNSPDGTARLVQKLIKNSHKNVKLILRKKQPGLTNSLQDGINQARGDVLVWLDCDFSHPPEIINQLLEKLEEGSDIVVASRFIEGGGFIIPEGKSKDSWLAIVLSRFMNYFIQFCLGKSFTDYTSGFIAAKKLVFEKIILKGDYGEYFIDLIVRARAANFKISEIPYFQQPRRAGKSKTGQNLWQYFKRGIKYLKLTLGLLLQRFV